MTSHSEPGAIDAAGADTVAGSARPRVEGAAVAAHWILAASFLGMPAGLLMLSRGLCLAFLVAVVGLATGMLSLARSRLADESGARTIQTVGLMVAAGAVTVVDPALCDSGMALALIALVGVARSSERRLGRLAALLAAGAAGLDLFGAVVLGGTAAAIAPEAGLVGAIASAVAALALATSGATARPAAPGAEAAIRQLVEDVRDAVLRFSADGRLLFASRSAEQLLGAPRYALVRAGLTERIHVLDRPAFLTALSEAGRGRAGRRVEMRLRRETPGESPAVPRFVWVEAALSPVPAGAGEVREVLAVLRDITEQRDRLAELEAARRAAEEASQAKSRFLAIIGHELRTPLNAVVGFADMLAHGIGGSLAPNQREYAELIGRSGRHLIEVVGMLLDMSRIEAGKFELDCQRFDPAGLIGPSLDMVTPLARERGIGIAASIEPDLPEIVADERACRQILINLLSNAIKFSHAGGEVKLTLRRRAGQLSVSVADRGVGMDADALGRVGEAFFQAQDGLDRRYEGTGLGLSIVKGLVELHQGVLHVISEPGQGTTVTVLLPINGPETKTDDNRVRPPQSSPEPRPVSEWSDARRNAL